MSERSEGWFGMITRKDGAEFGAKEALEAARSLTGEAAELDDPTGEGDGGVCDAICVLVSLTEEQVRIVEREGLSLENETHKLFVEIG